MKIQIFDEVWQNLINSCWKIVKKSCCRIIFVQKCKIWSGKPQLWGNLGTKLKFWAPFRKFAAVRRDSVQNFQHLPEKLKFRQLLLLSSERLSAAWHHYLLRHIGCGKKSGPLNFFPVFSATVWDFNMKFSSFSLLKPSTSNRQVKCDSVEKQRSYRLFNMIAYWFFGIKRCSS